ncbi:MAG TPA: TolC family protein [Gemmatimonadaceae bacterium]|nr:TolC family protein [Gemmatimonadaceae bacterium]
MSRQLVRRSILTILSGALAIGVSPAVVMGQSSPMRQSGDTLRLSVQDAVAAAQLASDEVKLSAALVDAADAQVALARSTGLPQLRMNTTYSHVYANARSSAVNQLFNQPNTYGVTASLSQTLFQGGRIVAATRAAGDLRSASRLDEQETRARLNVDVQRAYLNVLFAARLAEIQRSGVALAAARVDQLQQLQSAGRAARYDVLRARVERANLEPLAIQAENDRELAILGLKRLLNIPVERPIELTSILDADAVAALVPTLASLTDSTTLPDRAALRSAEFVRQSRREAIAVARADFLPSLSIGFNTGYSAFPPPGFGFPSRGGVSAHEFCSAKAAADASCQNGGWFADRSVSATLSFPIFDGLRARSNVNVAQAQLRIAELQLQVQRETVALEVASARAELLRARSVFNARQQNSSEAQEAFQLASLRFSRGLSTQLEVTDAQLALATAQSGEARATYDLYLATAELARALGHPIPFPPTRASSAVRRAERDS